MIITDRYEQPTIKLYISFVYHFYLHWKISLKKIVRTNERKSSINKIKEIYQMYLFSLSFLFYAILGHVSEQFQGYYFDIDLTLTNVYRRTTFNILNVPLVNTLVSRRSAALVGRESFVRRTRMLLGGNIQI